MRGRPAASSAHRHHRTRSPDGCGRAPARPEPAAWRWPSTRGCRCRAACARHASSNEAGQPDRRHAGVGGEDRVVGGVPSTAAASSSGRIRPRCCRAACGEADRLLVVVRVDEAVLAFGPLRTPTGPSPGARCRARPSAAEAAPGVWRSRARPGRRRPPYAGRCARPGVDLHDLLARRVEVPVREVGAHHEQHVAVVERLAAAGLPIRPFWPTWIGVVVLEPFLGLEGEHHRRGKRSASSSTSSRASRAPLADEQGHLRGVVDQRGRRGQVVGRRRRGAAGVDEAGHAPCRLGRSRPPTSPGRVSTATPRCWQRGVDGLLEQHAAAGRRW